MFLFFVNDNRDLGDPTDLFHFSPVPRARPPERDAGVCCDQRALGPHCLCAGAPSKRRLRSGGLVFA